MAKYTKSRTWGMVVYPESAPENWQELLSETFMQFAVSPLHDKDTNPDGEIKITLACDFNMGWSSYAKCSYENC